MYLNPLQFGSVKIDFPVLLAPMAGYTDVAMRTLCLEQGAGAVYTELTSAEGLRRGAWQTREVISVGKDEHPIAGHLFGADPAAMADAAKCMEQMGCFDWIDINCGCPVKKVVSRGAGAALLKDLRVLGTVVERVKASVSLPISVKTRIGFNRETAGHLEIARTVEQSGADMVAVHARLAKDFHGGEPDLNKLGEMKQALNIPIIGNGGVNTPADAQQMVAIAGVDGVMIGRGAIGNPWIFDQIRSGWRVAHCAPGQMASTPPSLLERRDMVAEHLHRLVQLNELKQKASPRDGRYTAEEAACIQFRTHIPYYVRGLFDKKQLLMKLAQLLTVDAILNEVDILVEKNNDSHRGTESTE